MDWPQHLIGFGAALAISVLTVPTGISGAVFLLPVQLSVLQVPNPAVTPTTMLFNVVAGPGALWRYARRAPLRSPLAGRLVLGTLPGVVIGSVLRVFVLADPAVFRLCAAALLLPLGVWLVLSPRPAARARLQGRTITVLALLVGTAGGIYGVGGGSLLGPILIAAGWSVAVVAPAALVSTFLTSIVGVLSFVTLSVVADGTVAPDWSLGIACGIGGLIGGFLGAAAQPYLPERALRRLAGVLATALALVYAGQALG